jgi:murein DD-endopeptidase MepM/ murein hydrolase activator NlpD
MRQFKLRSRRERKLRNRYGKLFILFKFLVKIRWVFFLISAAVLIAYPFIALKNLPPSILIKKRIFKPGQTIRILAENTQVGEKLFCKLKNRTHPFFNLNESNSRALVPISLKINPALHEIEIIFKNKILKKIPVYIIDPKTKPVKLNIAAFKLKERNHPDVEKESKLIWKIITTKTSKQLWSGVFEIPAKARFSAPFGQKRILPDNSSYFHPGLDIAVVADTPVSASADGIVAYVGNFMVGGKSIYIDHGHGVFSMYCHLNDFSVKEEDRVKKGQIIAKSGSTGFSNSPHLHWSVYVGGYAVDPLQWSREIF